MRIETERLIIRPCEPRDREALIAINGDPDAMRYFLAPFTEAETDAAMERSHLMIAEHGYHFVTAELKETGQCIGIIGMGKITDENKADIPTHPDIEIGWRLGKDVWGQGLAPEGAQACLDYAWDVLNAPEIVAITVHQNQASRRVMEKIGMTYDPKGDHPYPTLEEGHPLRNRILYRIKNPNLV